VLQRKHETEHAQAQIYSVVEAQRLVGREQWEDLDRMVAIPAGPFIMGTDLERADEQDKPRHEVTLPAFYLDKFLVTNAQYARFVASTQRRRRSIEGWADSAGRAVEAGDHGDLERCGRLLRLGSPATAA